MGIYTEKGVNYSGAGVLILEDYYRKDGMIVPCIVLVKNRALDLYTDFGGIYETKHGSLQQTASSELREESRNLLNISPHLLTTKIDIPAFNDHHYREYVLKINGINRKSFLHNCHVIDDYKNNGSYVPRSWLETNDIAHIPIDSIDFDLLNKRGTITLRDVINRQIVLDGRVKKVLRTGHNTIINMLSQIPMARHRDMKMYKSTDWTNKTYSYVVKN